MSQNEKQARTNQAVEIEDLPVNGDQAAAVKAGAQLPGWGSHGHVLTGNH